MPYRSMILKSLMLISHRFQLFLVPFRPESILDLGLRHAEQISLLEKVQNAVLVEQSILIEPETKVCPVCGH